MRWQWWRQWCLCNERQRHVKGHHHHHRHIIITIIMGKASFLQRLLDLIRVNPEFRTSMLPVDKFRVPSPASQPEYVPPVTAASNISKNFYYQRETRRKNPETITIQPYPISDASISTAIMTMNTLAEARYNYQLSKEQPPASPDSYFPIHCKHWWCSHHYVCMSLLNKLYS